MATRKAKTASTKTAKSEESTPAKAPPPRAQGDRHLRYTQPAMDSDVVAPAKTRSYKTR